MLRSGRGLAFNGLIQPLGAGGHPRFHGGDILREGQVVRVRRFERAPAGGVPVRGGSQRADILIDHPADGWDGELALPKLSPSGGELCAIRWIFQEAIEEVIGKPGGVSDTAAFPMTAEGGVVIPRGKEKAGQRRIGARGVAREEEVFIEAIQVAGQQNEEVKIDGVVKVQACGDAFARFKEGLRVGGTDETIEAIQGIPVLARGERVGLALLESIMSGVVEGGGVIDGI